VAEGEMLPQTGKLLAAEMEQRAALFALAVVAGLLMMYLFTIPSSTRLSSCRYTVAVPMGASRDAKWAHMSPAVTCFPGTVRR